MEMRSTGKLDTRRAGPDSLVVSNSDRKDTLHWSKKRCPVLTENLDNDVTELLAEMACSKRSQGKERDSLQEPVGEALQQL